MKWEQVRPSKACDNTAGDTACCFLFHADVYTHETILSCLLSRTNSEAVKGTARSCLHSVSVENVAASSYLGKGLNANIYIS